MATRILAAFAVLISFTSCNAAQVSPPTVETVEKPLAREVVVRGLSHPWGMDFLPDGRILVTERPGKLRVVGTDFTLSAPVSGVPEVYAKGQGGLLDVAVSPDFPATGQLFLSFAEEAPGGLARTAVARARLDGDKLTDLRVIFRQEPALSGSSHFGSRLVFDRDGKLFITTGDRFGYSDQAQNPASQVGKVVRLNPDGTIPADNPVAGSPVWSLGHRNVQGAALNPSTGELWITEHGPQGGDEVNITRKGRNYGWPVVTYGVEYVVGTKIGEGVRKDGMEDAVRVWTPSIAPSGMAFYGGAKHPEWKGGLLVAVLKYEMLVRLVLDGDRVVGEERFKPREPKRLRDVAVAPDGAAYVLTDEDDGEMWRVAPSR